MDSSKIELILQAKLEEGDAVTQAQQLGTRISAQIEQAFNGLGERIASKLFSEIDGLMNRLSQLTASGGSGDARQIAQMHSRIIPTTPWFDSTQMPMSQPPMSQQGPQVGAAPAAPIMNAAQSIAMRDSSYGSSYFPYKMQRWMDMGTGGGGVLDANISAAFNQVDYSEFLRHEAGVGSFSLGRRIGRLAGRPVNEAELAAAKRTQAERIADLASVETQARGDIESLPGAMKIAEDARNKANAAVGTAEYDKLKQAFIEAQETVDNKRKAIAGYNEKVTGAENGAKGIAQAESEIAAAKAARWASVGGMATGLGTFAGIAGSMDTSIARSMAGFANAENFAGRAALRGDTDAMLAQQMMGGDESVRGRAGLSAGLATAGKLLGGVGLMATAPITGGTGLIAGGGLALSGVRDLFSFGDRVNENMSSLNASKRMEQMEVLEGYKAARGGAIDAYGAAQATGAVGLSDFMTGATEHSRGGSLIQMLQGSGLSMGQMQGMLRSLGTSMGGVRGGISPLNNEVVQDQIAHMGALKGAGYSNIEDVAGAMYRSSTRSGDYQKDIIQAMKASEQIFGKALASGIDQSKLVSLMADITARAESLGQGGASMARVEAMQAMGLAGGAGGNATDQDVGLFSRAVRGMNDASRSNVGASGVAGWKTVRGLANNRDFAEHYERATGHKFDAAAQANLHQFGASEEYFKMMGYDDATAQRMMADYSNQNLSNVVRTNQQVGGDRYGLRMAIGQSAGSAVEAEKLMRGFDRLQGGAKIGDLTDLSDSEKNRLESFVTGAKGATGRAETDQNYKMQAEKLMAGFTNLATATDLVKESMSNLHKTMTGKAGAFEQEFGGRKSGSMFAPGQNRVGPHNSGGND